MSDETRRVLASASGVSKSYELGGTVTSVLADVSLSVHAGELALVMGPSGSGKTTLVSILAGLARPSSGTVELCGTRISHEPSAVVTRTRRQHLGFVFQTFNLFPALSATDNVAEVLAMRGTPIGSAREQARQALAAVRLAHRVDHLPGQLSGGERQRVAIARALATRPTLLIGDEPTAALDHATSTEVIEILRANVTPTTGVLIVTHDRRLESFADRVIELEDGKIKQVLRRSPYGDPPREVSC